MRAPVQRQTRLSAARVVCGARWVDLRSKAFANHTVAQKIVVRVVAIVVRDDAGSLLRFHVLADATMAAYLWDVLRDAMTEFGGRVIATRPAPRSEPEPQALLP